MAYRSYGDAYRHAEGITVLSGQNLLAGAVLGRVLYGAASAAAQAGNTGNGTMGAITMAAGALPGVYRLEIIAAAANAGTFNVFDPNGAFIGQGTVAVAFAGGGLAFTLADGATDFAVGDGFNITVAAGSGKYKEYNPANTDGSGVVAGILWDDVDASAADVKGVGVVRDCTVNQGELLWFTGASAGQITAGIAGLTLLGIICRPSVPA
jgi:hypothetical protein